MNSITPAQVRDFLMRHFENRFRAKGINPQGIGEDFNLVAAGIVDSFGVIEMIAAIEREFRMEIDLENLNPDDIPILGPFCQYVAQSQNRGTGPSQPKPAPDP
jgi:acyl carrier protein